MTDKTLQFLLDDNEIRQYLTTNFSAPQWNAAIKSTLLIGIQSLHHITSNNKGSIDVDQLSNIASNSTALPPTNLKSSKSNAPQPAQQPQPQPKAVSKPVPTPKLKKKVKPKSRKSKKTAAKRADAGAYRKKADNSWRVGDTSLQFTANGRASNPTKSAPNRRIEKKPRYGIYPKWWPNDSEQSQTASVSVSEQTPDASTEESSEIAEPPQLNQNRVAKTSSTAQSSPQKGTAFSIPKEIFSAKGSSTAKPVKIDDNSENSGDAANAVHLHLNVYPNYVSDANEANESNGGKSTAENKKKSTLSRPVSARPASAKSKKRVRNGRFVGTQPCLGAQTQRQRTLREKEKRLAAKKERETETRRRKAMPKYLRKVPSKIGRRIAQDKQMFKEQRTNRKEMAREFARFGLDNGNDDISPYDYQNSETATGKRDIHTTIQPTEMSANMATLVDNLCQSNFLAAMNPRLNHNPQLLTQSFHPQTNTKNIDLNETSDDLISAADEAWSERLIQFQKPLYGVRDNPDRSPIESEKHSPKVTVTSTIDHLNLHGGNDSGDDDINSRIDTLDVIHDLRSWVNDVTSNVRQ